MNDRASKGTRKDRPAAASSGADVPEHTIVSATHALSESLTAMMFYFASVRKNLVQGDHKKAEWQFVRFLEQSDRAHEIAEQIRRFMSRV